MNQYKYLKRNAVILLFPILICTLTCCGSKRNGADDAGKAEKGQIKERDLERNSERNSGGQEIRPEKIEAEYLESSAEYPIITETDAGSVDHVMESEGIYCVYAGRRYGFLTENGEEITPFVYKEAAPFNEGLACVCMEGKYGFIDQNGETVLDFIYDYAMPFVEGLAYFAIGDTYGFMDKSGNVVFYLDCDSVSSFQEGLACFSIDGKYGYIDRTGAIVIEAAYDDADFFRGGAAKVRVGNRYGVIDTQGQEVLPVVYEDVRFEEGNILAARDGKKFLFGPDGKDAIVKNGPTEVSVMEMGGALLKNAITPRIMPFHRLFLERMSDRTEEDREFLGWGIGECAAPHFRLYSVDGSDAPILFYSEEPYRSWNFPLSSSAVFELQDGGAVRVLSGFECGGSDRGDYAVLWYDKETGCVLPGLNGGWGGFGGFAYGGYIYSSDGTGFEETASFYSVSQTSGNYREEELLETPELFYDDDVPYTSDNVLDAVGITEYEINGERTTVENFNRVYDRYELVYSKWFGGWY